MHFRQAVTVRYEYCVWVLRLGSALALGWLRFWLGPRVRLRVGVRVRVRVRVRVVRVLVRAKGEVEG